MIRATIKDVALSAEVSMMTVSRVFRGDRNVAPETRQKVLDAAAELNYRPNPSARALRGCNTRTIGVIASNVEFISRALRRFSIKLMPQEYITCIIDSLGDTRIINSGLAEVAARNMDALIMEYRSGYGDLANLIQNQKNPVVFSFHQNPECSCDFCYIDLAGAYRDAIEYLAQHGRKKIYKLGQSVYFFREVFREYGLLENWLNTSLQPSEPNYANHVKTFIDFIENGGELDAVFCENDLAAVQICNYLKSKKIKVPQDVAIIGLSNRALSEYLSPALATIDPCAHTLGDVLFQMVMFRLNHPEAPWQHQVLKPEFILRESAICTS